MACEENPEGGVTGDTVAVWGLEAAENEAKSRGGVLLLRRSSTRRAISSLACASVRSLASFLSDLCLESEMQTQRN